METLNQIVRRLMDVQVDRYGQEIEDFEEFDHWTQREVEFDVETGERSATT